MAQADKDQVIMDQLRLREEHIQAFRSMFGHVDVDAEESISFRQLEKLLSREDVQAYLSHLDITVESTWNMFKLLDTDGSGELSIEVLLFGNWPMLLKSFNVFFPECSAEGFPF